MTEFQNAHLEVLGQEAHKGVAGPGPVSVAVTVTVNRVGAGRARA
jgi:hypothetical protein